MLKWIGGFVDRSFAVIGALSFSQLPLFMHQYQQHLSGRVAELQLHVQSLKQAARVTGKTLPQYISKFLQSADTDFHNQGEVMNQMLQRYDYLSQGYQSLQTASIYSKPYVFIKYFDWELARSTWQTFEMGFAFSLEGISYAGIGIIVGLAVYWILCKILKGLTLKWQVPFQR